MEEVKVTWEVIGLLGGLAAIVGLPFKFLWSKLSRIETTLGEHREMLADRYTKEETKEVIDWNLEPLARTAENLEETSRYLLDTVKRLEVYMARLDARAGDDR